MTNDTISWPALIRVANDADLLVVTSAAPITDPQWRADVGLCFGFTTNCDQACASQSLELIDSNGRVFAVLLKGTDSIELLPSDRLYKLSEVVQLVQQHAALQGHCCVAKIAAGSIQQAIQLVEHLNHE